MKPESIPYGLHSEKMEKRDYKSSLHYLALQPSHSGLPFGDFLLYFPNKDIGKFDCAISETTLRDAFHKSLDSYYIHREITCVGEMNLVLKLNLSLEKCQAPEVSIGKNSYRYS